MLRPLLAAALCTVACGSDPTPMTDGGVTTDLAVGDVGLGDQDTRLDADAGPERVLRAGIGMNTSFTTPDDGATALVVAGNQGGFHLEVGFLLQGFAVGPEWTVRYEMRTASGRVISVPISRLFTVQELMFSADLGGQFRAGDNLIFNTLTFDLPPGEGDTVTVFVEISMGDEVFSDTVDVVLDFP